MTHRVMSLMCAGAEQVRRAESHGSDVQPAGLPGGVLVRLPAPPPGADPARGQLVQKKLVNAEKNRWRSDAKGKKTSKIYA